ncbi:unnamed protein product [Enterobius vermicularis]|uniref:SPK domain-containing protein n=1 Tax=Enterobius vermicularis TaxID=51028 RepID=A0A0N4V1X7_ENTVE|nr:unnamed protein product [Enterobius vermicularis]
MEELRWNITFVNCDTPENFESQMRDQGGWISMPRPSYPIQVIIGLHSLAVVNKIIIEPVDERIPKAIEFSVGTSESNSEYAHSSFKNVSFQSCGTLTLPVRSRAEKFVEAETFFLEKMCNCVRLNILEPHGVQNNPKNQVGIAKIAVLGSSANEDYNQSRGRVNERSKLQTGNSAMRGGFSSPVGTSRTIDSKDNNSYREHDGFASTGGLLAEDPLTCVRTIRKVINERLEFARKTDREVMMTMCKRAIDRFDECEMRLVKIKSVMSKALASGDLKKVTAKNVIIETMPKQLNKSITALIPNFSEIIAGE